ncbi:hypothetical protein CDL12_16244 [Handroanthus impetiginosus]|uniref:Uncharacterized protein n=1 Tax=Handroanthus impetiginosus TaxID=429701 RepID=A0A2G9H0W8_9LAMI|nr:hypothetical protein CDL12_16244 [Handroanthus impetiginosus]
MWIRCFCICFLLIRRFYPTDLLCNLIPGYVWICCFVIWSPIWFESFSDPGFGCGELGSTGLNDRGRFKSSCTDCRFGLSVFSFCLSLVLG